MAKSNKRPLYQALTSAIVAKSNCEENGKLDWYHKWDNFIDELITKHMPHGSGIDAETVLNENYKNSEYGICINSAYHTMDNGFYGKWIHYSVTVKPNLLHNFELSIVGDFKEHQNIKEYLYDIYDNALSRIIYDKV